jgi:carotenoid cleavage dioxygenase
MSTANTAVGFTPDGKMWALHESGAPFRFRLGERGNISSIGYDTLQATQEAPISAHPKFDQRTGETFFHGRSVKTQQFYVGRAVDGRVVEKVDLKMPTGFHHDMFITENFVCVIDGSVRLMPLAFVNKKPLWIFDPKVKLRFGIFRRGSGPMTAESFTWIEAPVAAEIVHTLYAYDEGGKIVLFSPMSFSEDGKVTDDILAGKGPSHMHRLVIDVEKQAVDVERLPGGPQTEFPRIRDDRMGLRCRYGFSALQGEGGDFNFTGILKWDFKAEKHIGEIRFPEGIVGGEPIFFPRTGSSPDESGDDGYLGTFLWNTVAAESTFAIFDARSFSSTPVTEFSVPRRVPLGFHAAWITEDQFQRQLSAP